MLITRFWHQPAGQPNRVALGCSGRALLDWTQPDLAKTAGIALATLKRFEKGHRTPIPVIRAAIFAALEKAGVEFQVDGKRLGVSIGIRKVAK